jgi:hypothetical protein
VRGDLIRQECEQHSKSRRGFDHLCKHQWRRDLLCDWAVLANTRARARVWAIFIVLSVVVVVVVVE